MPASGQIQRRLKKAITEIRTVREDIFPLIEIKKGSVPSEFPDSAVIRASDSQVKLNQAIKAAKMQPCELFAELPLTRELEAIAEIAVNYARAGVDGLVLPYSELNGSIAAVRNALSEASPDFKTVALIAKLCFQTRLTPWGLIPLTAKHLLKHQAYAALSEGADFLFVEPGCKSSDIILELSSNPLPIAAYDRLYPVPEDAEEYRLMARRAGAVFIVDAADDVRASTTQPENEDATATEPEDEAGTTELDNSDIEEPSPPLDLSKLEL